MSDSGNTLDEFPAEAFTILAFCDTCGHRGPLDRTKVPVGLCVQEILGKLPCSARGSREASMRIVYTGSGSFHYGIRRPTVE
ncbi:MAG: hypothetical protein WCA32_06165 [Chromatiaceae bacterium]